MSLCLAPRASETEDTKLSMVAMQIMVATIGLRSHRRKSRRCAAATWNVLMSCTNRSISQSLSFSIFQFFNFLHKSTNRWEAAARCTLPFSSRRRACERPEIASSRTKSGAIPRKKQRAKRLPGAKAHFFLEEKHRPAPADRCGEARRSLCAYNIENQTSIHRDIRVLAQVCT